MMSKNGFKDQIHCSDTMLSSVDNKHNNWGFDCIENYYFRVTKNGIYIDHQSLVCITYDGIKALVTYDKDGSINKNSGLYGLGTAIGQPLDGRFSVISLENLRPYVGEFMPNDPQKRLDLSKPRLPNGETLAGFIGFAVNMIHIDDTNLFHLTNDGNGLRETIFYTLFSRLQVYNSRTEMIQALPCLYDGAISLDGRMIKGNEVYSLGTREEIDVKFR
ncbi:hypothetical protein Hdeb2414_s0035g00729801 [Helianthus debilis subsp. tardiflorus]